MLWFVGKALVQQWTAYRSANVLTHLSWGYILASGGVYLLTYAVLIQTWRAMLRAWNASIHFWPAAAIWCISSLTRYVPGKVWQIGAMGIMAEREKVPAVAAAGTAILNTVVNIAVGIVVAMVTGISVLQAIAARYGYAERAVLAAGAALVAAAGVIILVMPLGLPVLLRAVDRLTGRRVVLDRLPGRAIGLAVVGNVVAWLLYGFAFMLLVRGVTGTAPGTFAQYTALYSSSYVLGYLILVIPGGLGVRDASLAVGLGALHLAEPPAAVAIVVMSRLWLTILELVPGLLFLAWSGSRRRQGVTRILPTARPNDARRPAVQAPHEPRFAAAWAALVYALATLALGFPALAGRFLINPHSDQYIAGYAFRELGAAHLRSGLGFPQWNPYLFGGMPYVAAMHGDIFYPTFLLRMIMPTDAAMTWEFILHLFLAGCCTYGFLRASRLSFFPSLLGGLAYMLSGGIAGYASPGHDGKLFVSALLPLALWMLVRGLRDGRHWAWGALALVIGLAVLSPHPQLLQYMLLVSGGFALYLAFGAADDASGTKTAKLPRDVAMKRLGFALGAVVIGLLIGAVQFLPVKEYVPYSPRAGGRGYEFATTYSFPIEELLNAYLPQFSGILDRYWGRNGIHLHSDYVGVIVLMLAGVGLRAGVRRRFRWFWIGAAVVSLLWALGGSTPFYRVVYAIVPGTHYFRAPSTMIFVTVFSIAVLTALGSERLLVGDGAVTRRYAVGWVIAGVVIALLATMGGFTNMAEVLAAGNGLPGRSEMAAANNSAVIAGAWRSLLFVLLGAGVIIALQQRRLTPAAAGWALVVLAALDLWSIERLYWQFSPPAAVIYGGDPAIAYLEKAEPGRVIDIPLSQEGAAFHDPFLEGDGLMVHRVRQLLGYHGNELGRFQKLFGKVPDVSDYAAERILSPQVWRHENVRYLYTNADERTASDVFAHFGAPPPAKLIGPTRNAAGSTIYLYRLAGENPPAWLAPAVVQAPDDQALAAVVDARFDPTRIAIADTGKTMFKTQQVQTLPAPIPIRATVTRPREERISVTLDAPAAEGSTLVVSENYFPGWRASADGRSAPLDRIDFNLIGVQLPAGTRHVELSFRDEAYERGKVVTLVALALALLLTGGGIIAVRAGER